MNAKQYLNGLTLDQLKNTHVEIASRIKAIEDQEKITIYVVEGMFTNDSCFVECDFNKAKKRLCELIMDDEFTAGDAKHEQPKISVRRVYESELPKWMELNE